ncbi:hypothetical protein ACA910_019336 [Epithemia clementina (nom. ined.)]
MGSIRTKDPFGAGLKLQESHKQPIYCLDWSSDIFEDASPASARNNSVNGGVAPVKGKRGSGGDVDDPMMVDDAEQEGDGSVRRCNNRCYRVLASCASRYFNVYQLYIGGGVQKQHDYMGSPGRNEPLQLIQMYADSDVTEQFYTCVFAGRSITLGSNEKPSTHYNPQQSSSSSSASLPDTTTSATFAQAVDRESRRPTKLRRGNAMIMITETAAVASKRAQTHQNNKNDKKSDATSNNNDSNDGEETKDPLNGSPSRLWPLSGETGTGPQYLCVAGHKGTIKVIDLLRQRLAATLVGHGYEIYDLKICPTDEFILASASKDNTARLWNLKTGAQVAIFCGHEGHLDDVVSLAWHPSGNVLATGSMDTTVKLWYVGPDTVVRRAMKRSHAAAEELFAQQQQRISETRVVELQIPIFTTYQLHFYCVDCVHFLGDWILSRSQEDTVVLWEPQYPPYRPSITTTKSSVAAARAARRNNDMDNDGEEKKIQAAEEEEELDRTPDPFTSPSKSPAIMRRRKDLPYPVPNQLRHLRTFKVQESQYWFIRFGVDRQGKTLAAGNATGDIYIFKIVGSKSKLPIRVLDGKLRNHAAVRSISFSPDDSVMVAATDSGEIWKWDVRREKPVPPQPIMAT